MNLNFYRVRADNGFDKKDPKQFIYNSDTSKIQRLRLNKKGEQVLYTSTYPNVAEKETLKDANSQFYITKFKKIVKQPLNVFVGVDNSCPIENTAHSRKVYEKITKLYTPCQLLLSKQFGSILEKDYDKNDENKYMESSCLASEILKVADAILLYSKADEESNKYLNITFNKSACDNFLEIETIYHCEKKQDKNSLVYNVSEVGLLSSDKKRIEWYDCCVDKNSIKHPNFRLEYLKHFTVNIPNDIHGEHIAVVPICETNCKFTYKITLTKKSE